MTSWVSRRCEGIAAENRADASSGDQVMMLSGEYVTLNSHWEDWNLPSWHHPTHALNMTTIEQVNARARPPKPTLSDSDTQDLEERHAGDQASPHSTAAVKSTAPWNVTVKQTEHPADSTAPPHPPHPPHPPLHPSGSPVEKPKPRFPEGHPLSKELDRLQDAAKVIHFTALGKPWMVSDRVFETSGRDGHRLLRTQFQTWHRIAASACPAMQTAIAHSQPSLPDTDRR